MRSRRPVDCNILKYISVSTNMVGVLGQRNQTGFSRGAGKRNVYKDVWHSSLTRSSPVSNEKLLAVNRRGITTCCCFCPLMMVEEWFLTVGRALQKGPLPLIRYRLMRTMGFCPLVLTASRAPSFVADPWSCICPVARTSVPIVLISFGAPAVMVGSVQWSRSLDLFLFLLSTKTAL